MLTVWVGTHDSRTGMPWELRATPDESPITLHGDGETMMRTFLDNPVGAERNLLCGMMADWIEENVDDSMVRTKLLAYLRLKFSWNSVSGSRDDFRM